MHAICLDHTHPQLLSQYLSDLPPFHHSILFQLHVLFFFKMTCWVQFMLLMDMGQGHLPRPYSQRKLAVPSLASISCLQPPARDWDWSPSTPCWNINWLNLLQVLYRQPQMLWVHVYGRKILLGKSKEKINSNNHHSIAAKPSTRTQWDISFSH